MFETKLTDKRMIKPQKQKCPICKEYDVVELIYGTPKEEEVEKVRQRLALPGGLELCGTAAYKWRCQSCYHFWGKFIQE
jgi:hypothetical protein